MLPRKILLGLFKACLRAQLGSCSVPGPFGVSERGEATPKRHLRCKTGVSETLVFIFYSVPALICVSRVCQEVFIAR